MLCSILIKNSSLTVGVVEVLIQISPRTASLFVCVYEKRKKQLTENFVNCSLLLQLSLTASQKMWVER
jgi:hypothetical protein